MSGLVLELSSSSSENKTPSKSPLTLSLNYTNVNESIFWMVPNEGRLKKKKKKNKNMNAKTCKLWWKSNEHHLCLFSSLSLLSTTVIIPLSRKRFQYVAQFWSDLLCVCVCSVSYPHFYTHILLDWSIIWREVSIISFYSLVCLFPFFSICFMVWITLGLGASKSQETEIFFKSFLSPPPSTEIIFMCVFL